MNGAILHNKRYLVATRVFATDGDKVTETDQYNCVVFRVEGPAMSSTPYRGPIRIGSSFLIPEKEGSPRPAHFASAEEALQQGIFMCDKNSW